MNPVNPQALFNLLQAKGEYSSGEQVFLKLQAGVHKLRVCPPWSVEGSVCRMIVHHSGYKNKDGNMRMPLCYEYCFTNQNIGFALRDRKKLTQQDLDLFGKVGCVFCKISEVIKQTQGKAANQTFRKPAYFWNVVNRFDNKLYVHRTSAKFLEFVSMSSSIYPKMFDVNEGMDIMLNATGEQLQRRYTYNLIPNPCPIGIDLVATPLHDLDSIMADGYCTASEAAELIITSYPQMVNILGLNQMMTGVHQ